MFRFIVIYHYVAINMASHVALVVKNMPYNAGDVRGVDSTPEMGRSPGEENGYPHQYSCL